MDDQGTAKLSFELDYVVSMELDLRDVSVLQFAFHESLGEAAPQVEWSRLAFVFSFQTREMPAPD